jgi:hypothetical protein
MHLGHKEISVLQNVIQSVLVVCTRFSGKQQLNSESHQSVMIVAVGSYKGPSRAWFHVHNMNARNTHTH